MPPQEKWLRLRLKVAKSNVMTLKTILNEPRIDQDQKESALIALKNQRTEIKAMRKQIPMGCIVATGNEIYPFRRRCCCGKLCYMWDRYCSECGQRVMRW